MYCPITESFKSRFDPDASLVLVGIRGCGKRSLGFIAAAALNRRFITEDHSFKKATGHGRKEFLQRYGTHEYQKRNIEVLQRMLDDNRYQCVIECGLNTLTSTIQEHLRRYSRTNPVVYVLRDVEPIQRLLRLEEKSVRRLTIGDTTHRFCSNFEFYNLEETSLENSNGAGADDQVLDPRTVDYSFKLKDTKEDFTRFVRFITGAFTRDPGFDSPFSLLGTPPEKRSHTHAIFIRSSDLASGGVDLQQLNSGGDAIELGIDMWNAEAIATVSKQVSLLRRALQLPIIFSVDVTSDTIAAYGTNSFSDVYFHILDHGLRLGVEYLVVDLQQDRSRVGQLIQNRWMTNIIGHISLDSLKQVSWDDEACLTLYQDAAKTGCQLIRMVRLATDKEDNEACYRFRTKVQSLPDGRTPLIAFNAGPLGRPSQINNSILTSVTHPAIHPRARKELDPELTAQAAVRALFQSHTLDPLFFCILGSSVAYSISPFMHNAAYRETGLEHIYRIPEKPSLAELDRWRHDPHFGGTSVVQPWRVHVYRQLSYKSRHAEAVGAVNTIMPLRKSPDGSIYPLTEQAKRRNQAGPVGAWWGENTDWISIMVALNRNLSPRNAITPLRTTGLVIGAGGMARAAVYAMLQLGCRKIFILNRTIARAEEVAQHFNSWIATSRAESNDVVRVIRSAEDPWPEGFQAPSMIASCVPEGQSGDQPAANFEMPLQWLGSETGGVILALPYKSLDTPLLKQMRRIRSETGKPWVLVDGLEMVALQGFWQWELMTGRKAPRRLMMQEMLRNYVGEEGRLNERTCQARMERFSY